MKTVVLSQMEYYLEEILNALDFSALNQFLNDHMRTKIDIESLVAEISVKGFHALDRETICGLAFDSFLYEISIARPILIKILIFAFVFSVLNKLIAIRNKYISDMCFLMIYTTMMVLLMQSFFLVKSIVVDGMHTLLQFLSALIPTYATVLVFSGNGMTAAFWYELAFGLVYLMEYSLLKIFCPLIHIFVFILFLNDLFEEDKLSKLAEFLERTIRSLLKLSLGGIVGLSIVQSMITPTKDRLAGNMVLQGINMLPGVGNVFGSASEILISCGMVVKSSVGVVALFLLILFTLIPVIKVGCFMFMYHFSMVLLQPIVDKRILDCISAVARGCDLYMKLMIDSMILFFIVISIVGTASSFIY